MLAGLRIGVGGFPNALIVFPSADRAQERNIRGKRRVTVRRIHLWWLKQGRLVSAFAMNRPDEEREAAAEWVKAKQLVAPEQLGDNDRAVKGAALKNTDPIARLNSMSSTRAISRSISQQTKLVNSSVTS